MFALDVSQINWRTTVAHLPTEDNAAFTRLTLLFLSTCPGRGRAGY